MGKPAVQKKCLRCAKKFWSKPLKDKVSKKWYEEEYCQKCRHLRTTVPQELKNRSRIRVVANKIDVGKEVELLRRLEHYNPAILERIRKGEK